MAQHGHITGYALALLSRFLESLYVKAYFLIFLLNL